MASQHFCLDSGIVREGSIMWGLEGTYSYGDIILEVVLAAFCCYVAMVLLCWGYCFRAGVEVLGWCYRSVITMVRLWWHSRNTILKTLCI